MDRQEGTSSPIRRLVESLPTSLVVFALLALFGWSACASSAAVTVDPMIVPGSDQPRDDNTGALEAYYQTVFARMRDALRGGDRDGLHELRYMLQLHKKQRQ